MAILLFVQAPEGENQPSTEVDLFISTEKIMVLNTDLKVRRKRGLSRLPPTKRNPFSSSRK